MSSGVSIEVTGAEEAAAVFRAMAADTAPIRDAVNTAALTVQHTARQLAPVDTGRLMGSIQLELDSDGLGASVYSDVEYAAAVEYGTVDSVAQPYMHPAAESEMDHYVSMLEDAVRSLAA